MPNLLVLLRTFVVASLVHPLDHPTVVKAHKDLLVHSIGRTPELLTMLRTPKKPFEQRIHARTSIGSTGVEVSRCGNGRRLAGEGEEITCHRCRQLT